jgi:hypothetical protein
METETLVDIFLRTQEKTRSEIVEFLGFLFECVEECVHDFHYGKEI